MSEDKKGSEGVNAGRDFAEEIAPLIRNQINLVDNRPAFWAGFLAHVSGAMIADIGEDALVVYKGVEEVFPEVLALLGKKA